jgi:hypothetical protein
VEDVAPVFDVAVKLRVKGKQAKSVALPLSKRELPFENTLSA